METAASGAQAASVAGRAASVPWLSLKSDDFRPALAVTALAKSLHFSLHHLAAVPVSSVRRRGERVTQELSTDAAPKPDPTVDNNGVATRWWLGMVVPKRHARRSVTRSLLKHQIRAQADLHQSRLPCGQWVLRLRAPFDSRHFPSAGSLALQQAARAELAQVFAGVVLG